MLPATVSVTQNWQLWINCDNEVAAPATKLQHIRNKLVLRYYMKCRVSDQFQKMDRAIDKDTLQSALL